MLAKENRLRRPAEFLKVYKHGAYIASRLMAVHYLFTKQSGIRIGFVASKKVGKSCQRNRCKRLLRESMRPKLPQLVSGLDLVIVARPPIKTEAFAAVDKALNKLLRKASLFRVEQ